MSKFWIVTLTTAQSSARSYDVELDGSAGGMNADQVIKATQLAVVKLQIKEGTTPEKAGYAEPDPEGVAKDRNHAMTSRFQPGVYVWERD